MSEDSRAADISDIAPVTMRAGAHAWRRRREAVIHALLILLSLVPILTTFGIVYALFAETFMFFREVSIVEFLTGTTWSPLLIPRSFGILPLLAGTLLVTIAGMLIAVPVGLGSAIFLSEYASPRARRWLKPLIEVLAGIPTVVYGYLALLFITPLIRAVFPEANAFNALSAAIAVGIMIVPMVASLSEDALAAVPSSMREAAYALGANKYEVITKVVVPTASSGIVASFVLGISRAVGETMIVTLAAGATPKLTLNPLESIQTVTAFIVQISLGETPWGTLEYKTIFAAGAVLFVLTMMMNLLAARITKNQRRI